VKFEVLTVMIQVVVFCVVMQCSDVVEPCHNPKDHDLRFQNVFHLGSGQPRDT
jgi:hypothetical protein